MIDDLQPSKSSTVDNEKLNEWRHQLPRALLASAENVTDLFGLGQRRISVL